MRIAQVALLALIAVLGTLFYASARAAGDPATCDRNACGACARPAK
jgi:hypothetical protein